MHIRNLGYLQRSLATQSVQGQICTSVGNDNDILHFFSTLTAFVHDAHAVTLSAHDAKLADLFNSLTGCAFRRFVSHDYKGTKGLALSLSGSC